MPVNCGFPVKKNVALNPASTDVAIPFGAYMGNTGSGKIVGEPNFVASKLESPYTFWGTAGTFTKTLGSGDLLPDANVTRYPWIYQCTVSGGTTYTTSSVIGLQDPTDPIYVVNGTTLQKVNASILWTYTHPTSIWDIRFVKVAGTQYIVVAGTTCVFLDMGSGAVVRTLSQNAVGIGVSPNQNYMCTWSGSYMYTYDLSTTAVNLLGSFNMGTFSYGCGSMTIDNSGALYWYESTNHNVRKMPTFAVNGSNAGDAIVISSVTQPTYFNRWQLQLSPDCSMLYVASNTSPYLNAYQTSNLTTIAYSYNLGSYQFTGFIVDYAGYVWIISTFYFIKCNADLWAYDLHQLYTSNSQCIAPANATTLMTIGNIGSQYIKIFNGSQIT